jgi:hypothetical protein
MAICPNCKKTIASDILRCPACSADFTAGDGWKPLDIGDQWTGTRLRRESSMREPFVPNQFSPSKLRWSVILAIILILYALISLLLGQMYLPGKRGRGIMLGGVTIVLLAGAAVCAALNLLAVYFDHYDEQDNEETYSRFRSSTKAAAWILFIFSFLALIGQNHKL